MKHSVNILLFIGLVSLLLLFSWSLAMGKQQGMRIFWCRDAF